METDIAKMVSTKIYSIFEAADCILLAFIFDFLLLSARYVNNP